jgi:ribonucleotide reductase alpha subunit
MAQDLFYKILSVQREAGMPYLMNGDAANLKSNHRHLGYIRSSNLCLEVIEYTDDDTIASCNLASLSLRKFTKGAVVGSEGPAPADEAVMAAQLRDAFDFPLLGTMTGRSAENLNQVIDRNWYPLDKVEDGVVKPKMINKANKKHRPIGIGASGWAETLHEMDLPFQDPRTALLNKMVFACMYWSALAHSVQLAVLRGAYESFPGSPTSEGKLQFDLWAEEFQLLGPNPNRKKEDDLPLSPSVWGQTAFVLKNEAGETIDIILPTWEDLKRVIMKYGLHNSLLLTLQPTASTAQIRRNCESVEAHQNNLYARKVLKCSYPVLNRYLIADLDKLGLWNEATVEYLKTKSGSIWGLEGYIRTRPQLYPQSVDWARLIHVEKKYKTMWEIPQRCFMDLAADRARYIDQSASTNIYMKEPDEKKMAACLFYAHNKGLKTYMYYLRQTGGGTIKFTTDAALAKEIQGITVELAKEEIKPVPVPGSQSPLPPSLLDVGGTFSPSTKPRQVCTDEVCFSCT